MAGEISPDIMFWEGGQKVARMGAGGCILVRMGAIGPMVTGRSKNKAKIGKNGRAGHFFECMLTPQKCNMLTKMVFARREEQGQE